MGPLTTKYADLNDKKKKTFSFKYNEGIKEDNIKSIMDKYNLVYPIKEKLEILTKELEDLLHNETTKNNISFHDNETNSNQTDNSNQIGVLAKIKAKLNDEKAIFVKNYGPRDIKINSGYNKESPKLIKVSFIKCI